MLWKKINTRINEKKFKKEGGKIALFEKRNWTILAGIASVANPINSYYSSIRKIFFSWILTFLRYPLADLTLDPELKQVFIPFKRIESKVQITFNFPRAGLSSCPEFAPFTL